jgi:hypothetical protein
MSYTPGKGGQVLAATTAPIVAANVLPQAGMSFATQLSIAAAAGMLVWAAVYMLNAKFGKR